MFDALTVRRYSAAYISVIVFALGLALVEIYVLDHGVSYREVIVMLMVLAGLSAFAAGNKGLRVGLVFLVLTFALGYRTIELTASLRVHPAEFVLWGLLALTLVQRNRVTVWIPLWLIAFIPFWLWGWWPWLTGDFNWEPMFSEFKNFILLIPLFVLVGSVLGEKSGWRSVLLAFYLVGGWIAAMGIVEYVYPNARALFPTFMSVSEPVQTGDGFQRARFSFWGSADAVYVCVLALPIAAAVWEWWSNSWKRAVNVAIVVVMLGGIYISGHRNAWLMVALQFLAFAAIRKQYLLGIAVLLVFFSLYQFAPNAAKARFYSGTELLTGQPVATDSSGRKRWDRVTTSLNNTLTHPLGSGWTAAGWVHNDFLQVAENLGILAGALFLGAYAFTLGRLWRGVRIASLLREQRMLGIALLLSFTCAGIILATDANVVLPQLILPIWFVWVIAEIWLRQTRTKRVTKDETSFSHSAFANL
ncbi:MAG TPA: hypothetical protein VJT15_13590 [Pyrinomonadaceae bacterium]|nr:hypothetical protein [Pyrinomonadaceae bacterium]